jgi:hypothetical protein
MKIPDKIMRKVEELAEAKNQRDLAKKAEELAEAKRIKELEDLKDSRKQELCLYAAQIADWVDHLFQGGDGKRFFEAVDRIRIFTAPFWKGYPESKGSVSATIEINKVGQVVYSERYKGNPTHDTPLGSNPLSMKDLINRLHPDFLKQWAEHLTSGAVWDYIETAMPKKY